jgi:hypothetical protein
MPVFDEQPGRSGNNADPGYRQIAQLSSYGAQPSSLPGPDREDQLKIVASSERNVNGILIMLTHPLPGLCRNGDLRSIQRDSHRRGLRNLTHTICQAIAEIHAARRSAVSSKQEPGPNARIWTEVSRGGTSIGVVLL